MTERPLKALVVDSERDLLRHLSKFLDVVGYDVSQASDAAQAIAAVEALHPDFLIVSSRLDGVSGIELCRSVRRHTPNFLYTLMLVKDVSPAEISAALESGVDDFLTKPVVYGEVMTRLRAAARVVEQEHRVRQQYGIEPITGLLSASALAGAVRQGMAQANPDSLSVVMMDLDYFDRINRLYGWNAGNQVLVKVASQFREICQEDQLVAHGGSGSFSVLLPRMPNAQAASWCEDLRRAFSEWQFSVGEASERVTASFGVVSNQHDAETGDELLERASQCLRMAKASGRNCVMRETDVENDTSSSALGQLFDCTTARHVMTPAAMVLETTSSVDQAWDAFEQSRLKVLPVVNQEGLFHGLIWPRSLTLDDGSPVDSQASVAEVATTDVQQFQEDTSFQTLQEYFSGDGQACAIVVHEHRPTGLICVDSMAALSERIGADTFAQAQYSDQSAYLVVPDLCPIGG